MTLRERLDHDVRVALKAHDTQRVSCLRMLKARLLEREVALRSTHGLDYRIVDAEGLAVIAAYAKQRRESIESFERGGRLELAAGERAELEIVEGYLPTPLGEDELRRLVAEAVAQTGASGLKDLGLVMKAALSQAQGAADGKLLSLLAREALGRS